MTGEQCAHAFTAPYRLSAFGTAAGGWYRCVRDAGHAGTCTFTSRASGPFKVGAWLRVAA